MLHEVFSFFRHANDDPNYFCMLPRPQDQDPSHIYACIYRKSRLLSQRYATVQDSRIGMVIVTNRHVVFVPTDIFAIRCVSIDFGSAMKDSNGSKTNSGERTLQNATTKTLRRKATDW